MSHRDFINSFLAYNPTDSVELKLMHYLNIPQDSEVMDKLKWLGVFSQERVGLPAATPAGVLQHILEKKWSLQEGDKDMVVMWHKLGWQEPNGSRRMMTSSMVVTGVDEVHTAMSKTVGLPAAIAARLLIEGELNVPGVQRPLSKNIYSPILDELELEGITFQEKEIEAQFY
jgi:saccharopine dehydrogenase (NADP+, L-glutamate forming)